MLVVVEQTAAIDGAAAVTVGIPTTNINITERFPARGRRIPHFLFTVTALKLYRCRRRWTVQFLALH